MSYPPYTEKNRQKASINEKCLQISLYLCLKSKRIQFSLRGEFFLPVRSTFYKSLAKNCGNTKKKVNQIFFFSTNLQNFKILRIPRSAQIFRFSHVSPHVTESTEVLDSGFHPSGFRIPTLWIHWIPDSNPPDSGFQ